MVIGFFSVAQDAVLLKELSYCTLPETVYANNPLAASGARPSRRFTLERFLRNRTSSSQARWNVPTSGNYAPHRGGRSPLFFSCPSLGWFHWTVLNVHDKNTFRVTAPFRFLTCTRYFASAAARRPLIRNAAGAGGRQARWAHNAGVSPPANEGPPSAVYVRRY